MKKLMTLTAGFMLAGWALSATSEPSGGVYGSDSGTGNIKTEAGNTVMACENGRCPIQTSSKSLADEGEYVPSQDKDHAQ